MPIYIYKCQKCQAEFEALLSLSQKEKKVVCIACGSKKTKKLPASFTSKIKGSQNPPSSSCGGGSCSICPGCS